MHPLQDMEHIKTSTIQNFNDVYKKYSSHFFKEKLVIIQEHIKVCKKYEVLITQRAYSSETPCTKMTNHFS